MEKHWVKYLSYYLEIQNNIIKYTPEDDMT